MPRFPEELGPGQGKDIAELPRKDLTERVSAKIETLRQIYEISLGVVTTEFPQIPPELHPAVATVYVWQEIGADMTELVAMLGVREKDVKHLQDMVFKDDEVVNQYDSIRDRISIALYEAKPQLNGELPAYEELVLRRLAGNSNAQIAREFGVSYGSVNKAFHRIFTEDKHHFYREWLETGVKPDQKEPDAA